ncbi:MAG TPA: tRNA dihydrouridine synthase DusB [Armatimonadota bacterium]
MGTEKRQLTLHLRIGNIEISPSVVLAPMAGITNHSFRVICRQFGAGAVWTDMISSYGIHYRNQKTLDMFDWTEEERPVAVQIFGADPAVMATAAELVEQSGADIVDINIGCPVPKVRKTGAGASLIENFDTARKVMSAVVKAVRIPVTIKTRKGIDDSTVTAPDLARAAEDCGVAAVSIHGRTAAQGYSGSADWKVIAEAKKAVSIPVIGNGDVRSPEDAKRMFDETGCDGIMIGRGCLGNPWLFRRTMHFLKTGELLPEPSYAERIEIAREHLRLMVDLHGEDRGVREMRGQIAWYIKNMPGVARSRNILALAGTMSEMESALSEICN